MGNLSRSFDRIKRCYKCILRKDIYFARDEGKRFPQLQFTIIKKTEGVANLLCSRVRTPL